jgi:hypothetical protein
VHRRRQSEEPEPAVPGLLLWNVFYSYYDSSGQTLTTEVKSLGPEEAAYQLPYMVVVRGPPTA